MSFLPFAMPSATGQPAATPAAAATTTPAPAPATQQQPVAAQPQPATQQPAPVAATPTPTPTPAPAPQPTPAPTATPVQPTAQPVAATQPPAKVVTPTPTPAPVATQPQPQSPTPVAQPAPTTTAAPAKTATPTPAPTTAATTPAPAPVATPAPTQPAATATTTPASQPAATSAPATTTATPASTTPAATTAQPTTTTSSTPAPAASTTPASPNPAAGTSAWVADKESNQCAECKANFNMFRRRHHCRRCGGVFCGDCTKTRIDASLLQTTAAPATPGKKEEKVRVCMACLSLLNVPAPGAPPPASSTSTAPATPTNATTATTPATTTTTTTPATTTTSTAARAAATPASSSASSSSSLPKSTSTASTTKSATGTSGVESKITTQLIGLCCGYVIDGQSSLPYRFVRILISVEVGNGAKANNGRIIGVGSGGERLTVEGVTDPAESQPFVDEVKASPFRLPSWPFLPFPAGTRVLDMRRKWIMPGLIDCHVHPFISEEDMQISHIKRSSAYKALKGLAAVQSLLRCGWTSMRIAGDADAHFGPVDLKKSIEDGWHQGPRLAVAAHYISITGGGGDMNQLAPDNCCGVQPDGVIVDSPDEMRKAVRREKKYGGEWIKVLVTGAFCSSGDNPEHVHFTPEELTACVSEATRLGMPVMAHAHAAEGIVQAVRAGVRSVEHGSFINREGISLMVEKGTYLVPTMYVGEHIVSQWDPNGPMNKAVQLMNDTNDKWLTCLRAAVTAGVRIACGTDYVGWSAEKSGREFALMHSVGMTPMQTIQSATSVAAELLGWEKRVGRIANGLLADIIAVDSDPLADLSQMERVTFVMCGGNIIRHDTPAITPIVTSSSTSLITTTPAQVVSA